LIAKAMKLSSHLGNLENVVKPQLAQRERELKTAASRISKESSKILSTQKKLKQIGHLGHFVSERKKMSIVSEGALSGEGECAIVQTGECKNLYREVFS